MTTGPKIPPLLRVLFVLLICTVPIAWFAAWWNQSRNDKLGVPDAMLPAPDNKSVISLAFDPRHVGTLLISAGDKTAGGGAILWESTDKPDSELPTRDAGAYGHVPIRRNQMLHVYFGAGGGPALYSPDGTYIATWNGKLTVWKNDGAASKMIESLAIPRPLYHWETGTGKLSMLYAAGAVTAPRTDRLDPLTKTVTVETKPGQFDEPLTVSGLPLPKATLDKMTAVAYTPDRRECAAGDQDGWVYRFTMGSDGIYKPARKMPRFAHANSPGKGAPRITALAFSPDGKTLATGGTDGSVFLWRL